MPTEGTADPSNRQPRISCWTWWVGALHAPFLRKGAHAALSRDVAGNPGTPVGMTIRLGNYNERSQSKLSSRPERSVVEGSAVRHSGFPNSRLKLQCSHANSEPWTLQRTEFTRLTCFKVISTAIRTA